MYHFVRRGDNSNLHFYVVFERSLVSLSFRHELWAIHELLTVPRKRHREESEYSILLVSVLLIMNYEPWAVHEP